MFKMEFIKAKALLRGYCANFHSL